MRTRTCKCENSPISYLQGVYISTWSFRSGSLSDTRCSLMFTHQFLARSSLSPGRAPNILSHIKSCSTLSSQPVHPKEPVSLHCNQSRDPWHMSLWSQQDHSPGSVHRSLIYVHASCCEHKIMCPSRCYKATSIVPNIPSYKGPATFKLN